MALSVSNAVRTPGVGENVKAFDDGTGAKIQGIVVCDASGNPRIDTNPVPVSELKPPASAAPYMSTAPEGNADDVATGAITELRKIHCTLSKSVTTARWLWICDRAAMSGAAFGDLAYPPILIPEGGMIEKIFEKKTGEVVSATNLSFGISDESDTFVQSGTGIFRATWEA